MEDASLSDFVDDGADEAVDGDEAADGSEPDRQPADGEWVDDEGVESEDAESEGADEEADGSSEACEAVSDPDPHPDLESGRAEAADEGVAAEPATATYRWTPTGEVCARCDAVVERQWHDDGEFVCAECKEW